MIYSAEEYSVINTANICNFSFYHIENTVRINAKNNLGIIYC